MNKTDLTKRSIPALIRQIAIPASIGFFFNTMYNVIDTFYAGQISTEALASLSLSFPIFFIIIALSSGVSTGATTLIANALGSSHKEKTKSYATQAVSFAFFLSIILTPLGLILAPFLFRLLGATGTYINLSLSYINIIFYGSIFFIITFTMNAILNAHGDSASFRNFLISGFLLNIILDPIFMYGWFGLPAMGLKGVALATIIIELFGSLYLVYKVKKLGVFSGTKFSDYKPKAHVYKEIAKQGFPAALNMMSVALGIFIITFFLSKFGQGPVAAYGIATRIEQIFLMPTIGLNFAVLAIVGQNNGAGKFERIQEVIKKSIRYGLYMLSVGAVIMLIFAPNMMGIFTDDAAVITIGAYYLRIAAFISWAYVLLSVNISALQGLKKPMFALWMGLYRQIVGPFVIFTILTWLIGMKGVWYGIFLTVWSGAIFTVYYARRTIRKIGSNSIEN